MYTLWIVTDPTIKAADIGATMYILRYSKMYLANFFNAKLKRHQVTWPPCELEALWIGSAISHFAADIIQSIQPVQVLTDSCVYVQSYDKFCRGKFSTSSRVTTFLSTLSHHQAHLGHVSGIANLLSDFASRHRIECPDHSCQLCKYISWQWKRWLMVHHTCIHQPCVMENHPGRVPWSVKYTFTRPSKKQTNVSDVKRY